MSMNRIFLIGSTKCRMMLRNSTLRAPSSFSSFYLLLLARRVRSLSRTMMGLWSTNILPLESLRLIIQL